jgi:hypothetical protein
MFFFLIGKCLSGAGMYRSGTTCITDFDDRSVEVVFYIDNESRKSARTLVSKILVSHLKAPRTILCNNRKQASKHINNL